MGNLEEKSGTRLPISSVDLHADDKRQFRFTTQAKERNG